MTDTGAEGATLTKVSPTEETIQPDPNEVELRKLYNHRPGKVRLGLISSKDGRASGPDGSSRSLNSDADLRILRTLRATTDVVVVGANTARKERYGPLQLSDEIRKARRIGGQAELPALAVVSYTGNIPSTLTPADAWILTSGGSPATRRLGAEWKARTLIAGNDTFSPRSAIKELATAGFNRVLLEGGPQLAVLFLDRDLVDEYCLTTSPETGDETGPEIPPVPRGMSRSFELVAGDYRMTRWVK